ncbi:MAG: TonB-dependent receptor [Planctomycetota bacterium]
MQKRATLLTAAVALSFGAAASQAAAQSAEQEPRRAETQVRSLAATEAASTSQPPSQDPPGSPSRPQEPTQEIELAEETVMGSQERRSSTALSLQDAQQTALRKPGAVSIIDSTRFMNGRMSNAEDLLKLSPGVWVTNQNGGNDAFLSIRGSNISTNSFGRGNISYLDSTIPLSRIDSGTTNQLVNYASNQYVEVYRGGSALNLGASTIGGVINYVPHTGYTAEPITFLATHGDDRYWTAQVTSGQVIGDMDYYFSVDGLLYDGFREQGEVGTLRVASNIGWQLSDMVETRFYAYYTVARQELPGSVPKSDGEANPGQAGFFNSFIDTDRNWDDIRVGNKTSFEFGKDDTLTVSAYLSYALLDHLPTPFVGIIDNQYLEGGLAVQHEHRYEIGDTASSFQVGARWMLNDSEFKRSRYTLNGRGKGITTFDQDFSAEQVEVFFQNDWEFVDRWHFVAGLQYVYTDRKVDDNILVASPPVIPPFPPQPSAIVGDQSFFKDYNEFNPRVAFLYDLSDTANAFVSVSRASGFANGTELASLASFGLPVNAEAQVGWTYEIGTRGSHEDWLAWDVTAYISEIEDDLLTQQGPFPNTTIIGNFDTSRFGVELGGMVDLLALWDDGESTEGRDHRLPLNFVYNYSDFEFDGDPTFGDNTLPGIPEHAFYTSLEYEHSSGAYFGPNLRVVSGYPLTYDGTGGDAYDIDGFALLGVKGGYRTDRVDLFVDVRNAGNIDYLATGAVTPTAAAGREANVTPADDLSAYFGFNLRF